VEKIARDARAARVGTASDDADARNQDHSGANRILRERPGLVIDVPLVVLAVPGAVLGDAAAQGLDQLGGAVAARVEVHDEGLVLGVDQVVGAGCADLADLGRAGGGRERDRFWAAVDRQDEGSAGVHEGAAQRRKRLGEQVVGVCVGHRADSRAAEPVAVLGRAVDRFACARGELDRGAV
jgi:hypothetical protein